MVTAPLLTVAALPTRNPSVVAREGESTPDGFAAQSLIETASTPGATRVYELISSNSNSSLGDVIQRDGTVFQSPGDPDPGLPGDHVDVLLDVDHAGPGPTGFTEWANPR